MDLDAGTLTKLRAFEAVGRNLSFTKAASELCVTPAALSQHVRHLEEEVGVPLIIRLHRRIELTENGQRLLADTSQALQILKRVVADLINVEREETLTVSVAPFFSTKWLTPRLGGFWSRHPDIGLRLHHDYLPPDFTKETTDAGISWGPGHWPNTHSVRVLSGRMTMVCAPDYLPRLPPDPSPRDLLGHRLMFEFAPGDLTAWFRCAGVDIRQPLKADHVDDSHSLRQLAIDGHGAALFFSGLIQEDLRSGQLTQPFPVEMDPGRDYYLVRPKDRPVGRKLKLFSAWLMSEVAANPYA